MKQYLDMVKHVLDNGVKKENRTGVDTISTFAYSYKVDLSEGYPLLTTKKMYFNSMLHELFWYLSGEEHIKNLRKKTKIWDAWADEEDSGEDILFQKLLWMEKFLQMKIIPGQLEKKMDS